MHILLTGATGYIGKRLLPVLLDQGHRVTCVVRDKLRFQYEGPHQDALQVVEGDFLNRASLDAIPSDVDAAYYLIHSMSGSSDFKDDELTCAQHFRDAIEDTNVRQVIYLTGMVNEQELSEHLDSRLAVENELKRGHYALTALRAGIVIGSGSASFEIIRDLSEKLPVMVAPRWIDTRCQPIGIRDVLLFLSRSLGNASTFDRNFDIAGPDVLSYKEMLLGYASVRGLRRWIYSVPVMTPRLSSYWLYFITSTSYTLATSLVDSMKVSVVARDNDLAKQLGIEPLDYRTCLQRTFSRVERNDILSSWKDASASSRFSSRIADRMEVPRHGCFQDHRTKQVKDATHTLHKLWSIGGESGWYYANILWRLRGLVDKVVGGVGLRRGRTHPHHITAGDAIDFWRVIDADSDEHRLLLFAEMKLPGEAWLEFKLVGDTLHQTATFRPKGLLGRLYWYSVLPFHGLVFQGMINALAR